MDRFNYRGYKASFETLPDKSLLGRIVGIPDTITFRVERIEDAVKGFHECVDDFLEGCAEMNRVPPIPNLFSIPNINTEEMVSGSDKLWVDEDKAFLARANAIAINQISINNILL